MSGFEHEYAPGDPSQEDARRKAAMYGPDAQRAANDFVDFLSGGPARAAFQASHDHNTRSKQGVLGAMTGQQAAQNVADRPMTVGSAFGETREVQRHDSPLGMTQHLYGPGARITDRTRTTQPDSEMVSPTVRWQRGQS
jgi:hypothetical protein